MLQKLDLIPPKTGLVYVKYSYYTYWNHIQTHCFFSVHGQCSWRGLLPPFYHRLHLNSNLPVLILFMQPPSMSPYWFFHSPLSFYHIVFRNPWGTSGTVRAFSSYPSSPKSCFNQWTRMLFRLSNKSFDQSGEVCFYCWRGCLKTGW